MDDTTELQSGFISEENLTEDESNVDSGALSPLATRNNYVCRPTNRLIGKMKRQLTTIRRVKLTAVLMSECQTDAVAFCFGRRIDYRFTGSFSQNEQPFRSCPPSMDGQGPSGSQDPFVSETNLNEPEGGSNLYAGTFFPCSKHFVISGGHFTSNVTNPVTNPPAEPSDFPMIRLGDVDLRKEIRIVQDSGVAHRHSAVNSARRMYSARLNRLLSDMTVALYQGQNAEEDWRQDFDRASLTVRNTPRGACSSELHTPCVDTINECSLWNRERQFSAT
ncbi:hypothetical protein B0H10DRAFT_2433088 [Mycena sp. CBHHK59/15]|nr:hypothetical protein B0H10DRAFT_2433088 [Mycena sp. CBHHK59/15]